MNWPWLVGISFALGTLFQAAILVGKKIGFKIFTQKRFLISTVILAIILIIIGSDKYVYETEIYLECIMTSMLFGLFFVGMYSRELQNIITEKTLWQFNIIFLFVVFFVLKTDSIWYWILSSIAVLISAYMLINIIKNKVLNNKLKIASYTWFLFMNLIVIYNLWPDYTDYTGLYLNWYSLFMVFLIGAMFLMIMYYCLFIVISLSAIEFRQSLLTNYSDEQMSLKFAIIVIIIQGGLLIANHLLKIIPEFTLINISLLSIVYINSGSRE